MVRESMNSKGEFVVQVMELNYWNWNIIIVTFFFAIYNGYDIRKKWLAGKENKPLKSWGVQMLVFIILLIITIEIFNFVVNIYKNGYVYYKNL